MADLSDPRAMRVSFRSAANALPKTHYMPTQVVRVGRLVRGPGRTLCGRLTSKDMPDTGVRLCPTCAEIAVRMGLRAPEDVARG